MRQILRLILLRGSLTTTLLLFSFISTSALRRERLIDTWRPTHYEVWVTLNTALTEISSARVDIDIRAEKRLSLVDLDFSDLTTDAVSVNGKPVSYAHRSDKLEITLADPVPAGNTITVSVQYHGKPIDGLILSSDKDGKRSAIGDNWPDRVHHWIPCFDHPSAKATVSFHVTAPGVAEVVANGRLDTVQNNPNNTRTWTYNEGAPIPPYCMIIGVGEFARLEASPPTLTPLIYYVAHSDQAYAPNGFSAASPAVQLFSQIVGPYPYEKLALIIGATRFGGMENSSAIVFPPTLFNLTPGAKTSTAFGIPSGIERVVAHEIAHQWFGDSVTESTWADLWLSEGFATYFAGLFIQQHDGQQVFAAYMKDAAEAVFKYEQKIRTPIHDRDTERLLDLLNENNYQKGAWILHMLRLRLGDEAFFRGIRTYYEKHKNSTATTEDLRSALERSSGHDLRAFFDRWVYQSGHPKYELHWQWVSKSGNVRITLSQVQAGTVFTDPVPISIDSGQKSFMTVIHPANKIVSQTIRASAKPLAVKVDPQNTLLREVRP